MTDDAPETGAERRDDLYRQVDEGGTVSLWLTRHGDGSVSIDRFDHGPATERAWGGDYEHGVRFQPGGHPELAPDRLLAELRGRSDGVRVALERCASLGVAYDEHRWW